MRRHVELSVDLKDHATAKDGMHQYRNLCMGVSFAISLTSFAISILKKKTIILYKLLLVLFL